MVKKIKYLLMEEKCSIYVIVVTYKGKQWYDHCFTSLRESTIPVQTIVVDNASNDGTIEYIKEHYPEIILIESKENLGFGRANNIAMRYALDKGCDYVFLLNQDAWLDEPNTIEKLVSIYSNHPEYGILSPMHLNVDRTGLVMEVFCRQSNNKKLIEDLYFDNLSDVYDTTYIHAAAWMLSKNSLQIVGGFDPLFFLYGEDDNYLNRVIYHKLKIGICPSSKIIHDHHERISDYTNFKKQHERNLLVYTTNINENISINDILRNYFCKGIFFLIRNNIKKAYQYFGDYKYLFSKKKQICNSREINQQRQPSWLY